MIIVWGRRNATRYAGRMAEFCLVCRETVLVDVREHFSYPHVYFIPTSRREYHACETICRECGLRRMRPWSEMRSTVQDASLGKDAIIAATQGDFDRLIRPRIEQEAELRRMGQADRRISEIVELLVALEHTFSRRAERLFGDPLKLVLVLGLIAAVIGSFVYATKLPSRDLWSAVPWFWGGAALYCALAWVVYRWSQRRIFDRRIAPLLSRGLQKLHARQSELELAIRALLPQKLSVLGYIRPMEVLSSMS